MQAQKALKEWAEFYPNLRMGLPHEPPEVQLVTQFHMLLTLPCSLALCSLAQMHLKMIIVRSFLTS